MAADDADALLHAIEQAFAGLEPPGDDGLLHPDCFDDVDVASFYGGVRWQDMEDAMVVREYAAFSGFSAEAFRYYLPAYMRFALTRPGTVDYAPEALLRALDPGTPAEPLHDFQMSKFTCFDKPQADTVRRFLWHMAKDADLGDLAEQALANYWLEPPAHS